MNGEKLESMKKCCSYRIRKGEIGEEAVAGVLDLAAANPSSPLSEDTIIRSVKLPNLCADRYGGPIAATEADFVVLSSSCVFVIEAKNCAVHVDVAEDASEVRLYDADGNLVEGDPVTQNAKHAEAIRRLCKVYPSDRVFNVSAFVDPLSIGGCVGTFVGTRAVVDLSGLVLLLEKKQSELRAYLTQDWAGPVIEMVKGLSFSPKLSNVCGAVA